MSVQPYRPFLKGVYPVGALIVLSAVLEPGLRVWPLRLGEVGWRFGAVGMFSTAVIGVLFGIVCTMGIAALLGHRRTFRTLAGLNLAMGVTVGIVLMLFLLDALQLRDSVNPEMKFGFDLSVMKAAVTLFLSVAIAFAVGLGGWLSARDGAKSRSKGAKEGAGLLLHPQTQGGESQG